MLWTIWHACTIFTFDFALSRLYLNGSTEGIDFIKLSQIPIEYLQIQVDPADRFIRIDGMPLLEGVPANVYVPSWFGACSDDIVHEKRRSSLATLENLSIRTRRSDYPQNPSLPSSRLRVDSLTSLSLLPPTF